jgi:site-specific DNA-methyltransferase (cytosine-N4-specific)
MGRRPLSHPREIVTSLRLSKHERSEMVVRCKELGFKSISDYLRHLHNTESKASTDQTSNKNTKDYGDLFESHSTKLGAIYQGNSLAYLHNHAKESSVNLIMTSPPFGLVRKKSYGNEDADKHHHQFLHTQDRRCLRNKVHQYWYHPCNLPCTAAQLQ